MNAAVEWGESVAVLGANGSGKSTFLRLLDGLVFPESGAIFFEGVDIGEGNLKACNELNRSLRSTVGFVFQN
ncbi:ATP-binding cassette domain-containing protein, partial [Acinetobacter baumannii]